jgi:cytochrome c oxidase subunit 2
MLDKFERTVIGVALLVSALFVFSLLYAMGAKKGNVTECLPYDKSYEDARVNQVDKNTYQVFYVASMWHFEPSVVYIPVGSEVDFFVTSKDVVHGFDMSDKNVNLMGVQGAVAKTTVKFDKPGVYKVTCHEFCGTGHQNMQAEVIVNYPTK